MIEFLDANFWRTFVPQLLAALVGAGVGVFGVLLGFRLQRSASREDAVDAAIERLLVELSQFAEVTATYADRMRFAFFPGKDATPVPTKPLGFAVGIAFEIVAIRTRGRERIMAKKISAGWDNIMGGTRSPEAATATGLLAGLISEWRTQGITVADVDRRLGEISVLMHPPVEDAEN